MGQDPERRFDRRADQEGEGQRPDPDFAAEGEAGYQGEGFDASPDHADSATRAPREHEHQRVARASSVRGADVERRADPHQRNPERKQRRPRRKRRTGEIRDCVDPQKPFDEEADQHRVGDGPEPGRPAERPGNEEHDQPDGDVRQAEGERRVPRDALVEHVPGRQAKLRLEQRDDSGREQEQPEDEAREARDVTAADAGMRYSPNGLIGFGLVETITLFVSRYRSSVSTASSRPKPDCL